MNISLPCRRQNFGLGVRKPGGWCLPGLWLLEDGHATHPPIGALFLVFMKWGHWTQLFQRFFLTVIFFVSPLVWWELLRWSGKIRGMWGKPFPHCICILEYNKTLAWAVLGNWAFWMGFVSFPAVSCHSVLLLACLLLATPVLPSWLLPLWSLEP